MLARQSILQLRTPDPTQQARQSEAFEALRSDQDRLAMDVQQPAETQPLRHSMFDE